MFHIKKIRKPTEVQLVATNHFHELLYKDMVAHLTRFMCSCSLFKTNGVLEYAQQLRLFFHFR